MPIRLKIKLQNKVDVHPPDFDFLTEIKEFPDDYVNFLNNYGEGIIGGYLRIWNYQYADHFTGIWRRMPRKYFASARYIGRYRLSKNKKFASEAFLLGDTTDGDQVIYWNNEYYVYCFQATTFFERVGENLEDVLSFYASGKFWEAIDTTIFTPIDFGSASLGAGYLK